MNNSAASIIIPQQIQEGSLFGGLVETNPVLASMLLCVGASVAIGTVITLLSFYFSDPFTTTFQAISTHIFLSFGVGGASGVVVLLMTGGWFPQTSMTLLLYLVATGIAANLVVSIGLIFFLHWLHGVLSTKFDLARDSSGLFRWLPVKNVLMQRLR